VTYISAEMSSMGKVVLSPENINGGEKNGHSHTKGGAKGYQTSKTDHE